ncbi:MAG: hypothetical protein HQL77_05810 [Magnetococcales bacterium]|nr:hypothetical protein [Magnetococcales bacterium]
MPKKISDTGLFQQERLLIDSTSGEEELAEFRTLLSGFGQAEDNISISLEKAKKRLQENGITLDIEKLPGKISSLNPPVLADAADILYRGHHLRKAIQENDATRAAQIMWYFARSAMRMDLRKEESHAKRGKNTVASASKGGKQRVENYQEIWQEIQEFADSYWEKRPEASKSEVAKWIVKQGLWKITENTIRQKISSLNKS